MSISERITTVVTKTKKKELGSYESRKTSVRTLFPDFITLQLQVMVAYKKKNLKIIRPNLFWPGMINDVRDFIRLCETWGTTKSPNQILKPDMGKPAYSIRPFQRLYIDLLGPYPRSGSGNIGILIVFWPFVKDSLVASSQEIYFSHPRFLTATNFLRVWGIRGRNKRQRFPF